MAVSIDPKVWEELETLREEHARRARELDRTRRAHRSDAATDAELREAERLEREAYAAWRTTRLPMDRDPAYRPGELPPVDPKVPRDA